jgi:adenosylmethionine-8-amino-7-oxononanoate aminotransferase
MVGIEIMRDPSTRTSYEPSARMGHRVTLEARRRSVIVRPLGDVVVLNPPLAIDEREMELLVEVAAESIRAATREA